MAQILLVSNNPANFSEFASELKEKDAIQLLMVESAQEALRKAESTSLDVVVTDEELSDGKGLELVKQLVQKFPLVNCVMVNTLPADDFHEYTEGLGVLMQLPPQPTREEAKKMLSILDSINVLLKET